MVALTGILVNDSLVLVDFINHRIRAGESDFEASVQGAKLRLRAILLTTLTTVSTPAAVRERLLDAAPWDDRAPATPQITQRRRRAQAAGTDNQDGAVHQLPLSSDADFLQDDVPGIPFQLFVRESHVSGPLP